MNLWKNTPGMCNETPQITPYIPANKKTDAAVVIFAGGGYCGRAEHEGQGYAEFLAQNGITAFVVDYRVAPHSFPLPLLDARRAIRFVRHNAKEYGINPQKIAAMGSSAGGHLTALLCTYQGKLDFEGVDQIDNLDYLPNAQILCYPVIVSPKNNFTHKGSYINLLGGEEMLQNCQNYDPSLLVNENTPPAFIWHTSNDGVVNVKNSTQYLAALNNSGVLAEMHIFPNGPHGMGLANDDNHVAQWSKLLLNWFKYLNWLQG